MSLGLTDEEWALIRAEVAETPPLTAGQISRLSVITGLMPVDDSA